MKQTKEHEKILDRARTHYKMLNDLEYENKNSFVENMKFAFNVDNGQWDESDVEERDNDGRPHLSMNKLGKFVAMVVNSEKGQPNTDDIIPVDDKGDVVIAQIYNELINDIEYRSDADDVYSIAGEHAVAGGFGYWRILTEYCDDGFDQEIKIKAIKNPLMVSIDPKGNYAFIREALSKEEFEEIYPKAEINSFENSSGFDDWELWYCNDKVFISEYFLKVPKEKEIIEIKNPETGETAIIEKTDENKDIVNKFEILRSRMVKSHEIKWYKITGVEVLEEKVWPGNEIPIIEVSGHEVHLEGKNYKRSLVSDAKDGQRMYNYWLTSLTEKIALAPKAPYLVTEPQIKGYEDTWKQANRKNYPYLLYNSTGQGVPQRALPAPVDPGAMTMLNIANTDIKDILGMYESSLGAPSNERSAKAISARNARSDLGTYAFQYNLRRAKIQTKKILIDLIPKIYDNERVVRLRGKDLAVRINFPEMVNGKIIKMNDLSRGRYDIRARMSGTPSRRQQTVDNILQAMQYAPNFSGLLLPLVMKYLDAPGSEEIAATLMPAIQQQQAMTQDQGGGNV